MGNATNSATTWREVALIINLRSRLGFYASRRAVRELERNGLNIGQDVRVRSGRQLRDAVSKAVRSGLRTIVVGGGDGTISAAAGLFANRPELTLGLLPIGTGNETARVLGIPLDLPGACKVVAEGQVMAVDLGQANGRYFIHTALIGFPAHVNHTIPGWLKRPFGKPAYVYSLLSAILRIRPFRATVLAGDARWEGETSLIAVGNARFHVPGRILLPPSAAPKGGLLVYGPLDNRRSTLIRLAFSLWLARRPQPASLFALATDQASVLTDLPQDVDLDGEFGGATPIVFHLAREALRVIVPRPAT